MSARFGCSGWSTTGPSRDCWIAEQRERMLPELQVNLRRTNRFLRVTMFVFGYLIVNSLAGLFAGPSNLSESATMSAGRCGAAHSSRWRSIWCSFRLYRFGIEESAAIAERVVLRRLPPTVFSLDLLDAQAFLAAAAGRLPAVQALRVCLRRRRGDVFAALIPFLDLAESDTVAPIAGDA